MARDWSTVRVFISSTFRDMHAERDHLVRVVFPELKERCRQRHVRLIEVDLRWGVTEQQAEGGEALDICLDEIDSCRPFFLGLLGHRYGYIPPGEKHSITAHEIYHGVLHNYLPRQVVDLQPIVKGILEGRTLLKEQVTCLERCYHWDADKGKYLLQQGITSEDREMLHSIFAGYSIYQRDRSFFFFRSQSLTKKLSQQSGSKVEDYFETEEAATDKLGTLKKDVIDAGLSHFEYNDLETFGQMVLDTLWQHIDSEFPVERAPEEHDWLQEEAEFHELFMEDRTRRFVGRSHILKRMHAFVDEDSDSRLMVITGEPGSGKSALISRFTEEVNRCHPDWLILSHFVGASPSSTSLRRTLRGLCAQLNRVLGSEEEVPEEYKELAQLFPELLQKASETRRTLIIIDALNQFERIDNAHTMRWLPHKLPENVKVVVSTLAGETLDALKARTVGPWLEELTGLTEPEIKEFVNTYLKEIRKDFPTSNIREAFFENIKAGNPLYILVALEELRVFPVYEELGERINSLPDTVSELFAQVLERIEGDFSRPLVRDFTSLIACGRQGMTGEELQTLLKEYTFEIGIDKLVAKLPDMLFSRLRRAFSAYLFERSGVIDFFHGQLKEVVGTRYLADEADLYNMHQIIADYFRQRWAEPYPRALDELPHQLTKAKDWEGVEHVLCDLSFIEAKCSAGMANDLVADYTCLDLGKVHTGPLVGTAWHHKEHYGIYCPICLGWSQISDEQLGKVISCPLCQNILKVNPFVIEAEWYPCNSGRIVKEQTIAGKASTSATLSEFADFVRNELHILSVNPRLTFQQAANQPSSSSVAIAGRSLWEEGEETRPWLEWINKQEEKDSCLMTLTTAPMGGFADAGSWDYSPDGRWIATISDSGKNIDIWSTETGEKRETLANAITWPSGSLQACVYSPDGFRIAVATRDNKVMILNTETGEELLTLATLKEVGLPYAFSPDGRQLVIGAEDNTMRVWDVNSGEKLAKLQGRSALTRMCTYSPDKDRILGAGEGTLKIWHADTGRELVTLTRPGCSAFYSYAYSPDGKFIISGQTAALTLWDVNRNEELATLGYSTLGSGVVYACAFSPDGRRIVLGFSDGTVNVWDAEALYSIVEEITSKRGLHSHEIKGRDFEFLPREYVKKFVLSQWAAHSDEVLKCIYSHDGRRIITGSVDGTIKIWDAEAGKITADAPSLSLEVNACAVSPNNRRVALASWGGMKILDRDTGQERISLTARGLFDCCSYSPDGSRILSGHSDNKLRVWDAETGEELTTLCGHRDWVKACAFSPDGYHIASGSQDKSLKIWNSTTGEELATLSGHLSAVEDCAYSPDGRRILAADRGHVLKTWDAESGEELATLDGDIMCAFSPDGRMFASYGTLRGICIWDAVAQKQLRSVHTSRHGKSVKMGGISCPCKYTPDGRRIIVSAGKVLEVRDSWNLDEIATFFAAGNLEDVATLQAGDQIVVVGMGGIPYFLRLMGVDFGPPLSTIIRLHLLEKHAWDSWLTARCAWCGKRFPAPDEILDVIRGINQDAKLSPDQSPCLELPAEAWEEPRLISECPHCRKPLKFNPFIVDNKERY
ncbi:DUF4062 domain-containing protein [Chloroflexota bacterium]